MKMIRRLAGALAACLWLARLEAAEPPTDQPVGEFSDVTRLAFTGNKAFSEAAIRDGLLMNPDFLLAAHPAAPLGEFLSTLQSQVLAGFQAAGFPQVRVTSRLDGELSRIAVTITEGPRFQCGAVKVSGAKKIPADALVRLLTQRVPKTTTTDVQSRDLGSGVKLTTYTTPAGISSKTPERSDKFGNAVETTDAVWEKGKPAPFADASLLVLKRAVTNALAELGFFFPRIAVKVVPDANTGTADLHVEIQADGPPGVIGRIEVRGNERNRREDILKYLGLAPGLAINQELITRCELKLWNSARFLRYTFTTEPPKAGDTRLNLRLELTEHKPMPPLRQELSPEAEALLKSRDWLAGFPARAEDMILTARPDFPGMEGIDFIIVLSPGRGILFTARPEGATTNTLRLAVALTGQRAEVFSPPRRQKLLVSGADERTTGFVSILPNEPGNENPFIFSVGGGFRKKQSADQDTNAFKFDLTLAPVAFADRAYNPKMKCTIMNGLLRVTSESFIQVSDAATGRLIKVNPLGATSHKHDHEPDASLAIQTGTYERMRHEIEAATAGDPNLYDAGAPVSSTAGFLLAELVQSRLLESSLFQPAANPGERTRAVAVLGKLLDRQVLSPFDRLLASDPKDKEETFSIPSETLLNSPSPMQAILTWASTLVFKFSNDFFPKSSWPWTLAREAVFVAGGKSKYTERELERIYESPETGPLGYWAAAQLLRLVDVRLTRKFAARGFTRLDPEDFRKDCRLVLTGGSVLHKSAEKIAAALRDLKESDLEALVAVLPPVTGKFIRDAARLLRENPDKPLDAALAPALDELWEGSLKQKIRSALRELTK